MRTFFAVAASIAVVAVPLMGACSSSSDQGLPSLTNSGSQSSGTNTSSSHSSSGHASSSNHAASSSTGVIPDAGPPVAVTGTIGGKTITAANVLSFLSNGDYLALEATDDANFTCDLAASTAGGVSYASVASLSVSVISNMSLVPGVYSLGADGGLAGPVGIAASYTQNDANCTGSPITAVTGSVTIAAIDNDSATGSFHFGFGSNGQVSGTFNTPFCVLSLDGGTGTDAGSCRPRP